MTSERINGRKDLRLIHLSHEQVLRFIREGVARETGWETVQVLVRDSYWQTRVTTEAVVRVPA